jgi:predicted O-linked N-acetylglucosamine transferase (SPINDLY family)
VTPGEVAALLAQGQREEALAAAARAVNDNPQDAGWRVVLGAVLVEMQQLAEGERVLRDALAMAPDSPEALFNLSVALRRQGRAEEQAAVLARIPASWPGASRVLADLGQAALFLLMSGRHEPAVGAYRAVLNLQPGARPALYNMALALMALRRYDDVSAVIREAFAAGHRDAELLGMLANAKGMGCDWENLDAVVEQLRAAAREAGSRPVHPQTAQYLPQVSASEQKQWAEAYSSTIFAGLEPVARPAAAPSRRLRVGYVSSDFRDHAVAWLAVGLLEHHDRERFEVFAYSTAPSSAPSEVGARIARAVEHAVNAGRMTGREIAERIAADGIDVLVDLGGHTQGARLDVLAYRAAPAQLHFLGYAGTTGAAFVDGFVADEVTVPPGAEADFTERVLRMDRCFMPSDPKRALPRAAARKSVGLPAEAVVLCSFNQAVKIRPETFAGWCAILQAVPNAVLWLRDPGEPARSRLVAAAARWRVEPRLAFAAHVPSRAEHMARLAAADIALDTFPYGSHTNATDALWAGVPLITTRGATFASRVAASMLHTAGLDEWVFDDAARASAAVIALARDPAALAAAKEKARAARQSPLFDAAGFARDFERVLLQAAGREAA